MLADPNILLCLALAAVAFFVHRSASATQQRQQRWPGAAPRSAQWVAHAQADAALQRRLLHFNASFSSSRRSYLGQIGCRCARCRPLEGMDTLAHPARGAGAVHVRAVSQPRPHRWSDCAPVLGWFWIQHAVRHHRRQPGRPYRAAPELHALRRHLRPFVRHHAFPRVRGAAARPPPGRNRHLHHVHRL